MEILLLISTVLIIGAALTQAFGRASMQSSFQKLGTLTGRSYCEIVDKVGPPCAVSSMGDGTVLKQWQATGYNIALLFDSNDICLGVTSEVAV